MRDGARGACVPPPSQLFPHVTVSAVVFVCLVVVDVLLSLRYVDVLLCVCGHVARASRIA